MDITLVVIGFIVLLILGIWIFSFFNNAEAIDTEEERQVRSETSAEHERAAFEEASNARESNAADIDFYSHDPGGE